MHKREWRFFIFDISDSVNKILKFVDNSDRNDFFSDEKTFDAVMRNLEIIGEAAKKIPSDIKEQFVEIEWKKISGLRDIVIHEYFGIDEDIIWDVIENKIPELKENIKRIINYINL